MNAATASSGRRILILPPNWLGDVIMAQPAMRAIAQHHRHDRLSIHGRPWLRDVLPYLNLGQASYEDAMPAADRAYLFPNSFGSAWRAWRGGCRERIGFTGQWRRLLLTQPLAQRIDQIHGHHRHYFLDIPTQLGIDIPDTEVRLVMPDGAASRGRESMQRHGLDPQRTVCIAPGAQFGGAKRYPAESYAGIVARLSGAGWHVLVLGTGAERAIGDACLAGAAGPVWNSAGETGMAQVLQLLGAGRLLLCNDSGLMHVAAGLGRPVVAIFGATDPARTAPSGPHAHVLFHPAPCSPCLQRECTVAGQPCMANVSPDEVFAACVSMLEAA
jgi:heptosyltransferase-2